MGEGQNMDQLERYVRWYREGHLSSNGRCFDIGNTIRSALHRFERTKEPFSGSTDPLSAGNGSIMCLARGSFKHRNPPEIKGSGYVVESLEAALWLFTDYFTGGSS